MENLVIKKKAEILDLLTEFKQLIKLHNSKVSEYLKNEYYFQDLEQKLDDKEESDIEDLRKEHYDLGKEFREIIIKYNIDRSLIKESTINTFLREKPFNHILKGEEPVIDNDDFKKYPIVNNLGIKQSINEVIKEQIKEESKTKKKQSKTKNKY